MRDPNDNVETVQLNRESKQTGEREREKLKHIHEKVVKSKFSALFVCTNAHLLDLFTAISQIYMLSFWPFIFFWVGGRIKLSNKSQKIKKGNASIMHLIPTTKLRLYGLYIV